MKKISLMTQTTLDLNGVGVVAHIGYTYFSYAKREAEPDFQIKSIQITFDGIEDSPVIETEDELFFSIIEKDETVNAVYAGISDYVDQNS